jgi:predicted permease
MRLPAAVRTLGRARGYALLAVLTLALAVGANLVVFTLVNALWLRPRPVADPDRVVVISNRSVPGSLIDSIRTERLESLRAISIFESLAGQVNTAGLMGGYRVTARLDPVGRDVETAAVTHEYFSVLGLQIRGRDFTGDDDRAGAPPTAIVSDRLWRTAFGARSDIIGSTVRSSHGPIRLAGVAPAGFHGARLGEQFDVWVPRAAAPVLGTSADVVTASPDDGAVMLKLMPLLGLARLRPGVTPAQAEQHLTALDPKARYVVRPLAGVYGSPARATVTLDEGTVIRIVAVTSGLVLLAGCATLAALVLVHYERRRRELAIRLAIGSSRRRLAARLTMELLVLAAAGTGLAVLIAGWSLAALPALTLPGGVDLDRLDLRTDGRVVTVAASVSALAMLLAGGVPLIRFSRPALALSLTAGAGTAAPTSLRFRRALLATHAGATLVVLVAAGLFVQTMRYGFGAGAGFDVDRTLFLGVQPGVAEFFDPREGPSQPGMEARKRAAYLRLLEDLAALPGVSAVAVGSAPLRPDADQPPSLRLVVDGQERQPPFGMIVTDPAFSQAIGLPILAGRGLTLGDGSSAALVTSAFASAIWPDATPIGRHFARQIPVPRSAPRLETYEVVGVVPDFVSGSLRTGGRAGVILARGRDEAFRSIGLGVVVGTTARADELKPRIERLAADVFPKASRLTVESGADLVARDLGRARLGAWFFSGFGAIALGLGLAGVFGLVAYLAEARRRELGIRMALGAEPGRLVRSAIGTGLVPVAIGVVAGLVVAALLARSVESLLHGVSALDPLSYTAAGLLLLAGAAAAGAFAAWRIRRVSPMDALRVE